MPDEAIEPTPGRLAFGLRQRLAMSLGFKRRMLFRRLSGPVWIGFPRVCRRPACLVLVLLLAVSLSSRADNIVPNPSFENGTTGWDSFVPGGSQGKNCRFSLSSNAPHTGANCLQLQSDDFARFSIFPKSYPGSVKGGDRYRISVWVRADPQAQAQPKTEPINFRVGLHQSDVTEPSNTIFIGVDGQVTRNASPTTAVNFVLPITWTKIEAVLEIPSGVDQMNPELFVVGVKGTIFVDDYSVEKVDATTALSSVIGPVAVAAVTPAPPPQKFPGPDATDAVALAELNLDAPGMEKVKAAAQSGNLSAVKDAYLDYRRTACPAKWETMPSDEPATATEQTDKDGDEVLKHYVRTGAYAFSFVGADMGKDFNWTYNPLPTNDPNYTVEWTNCAISRTGFWKTLGDAYWKTRDEKYAIEWVAELKDFAAKNPLDHDAVNGQPALWRTLDAAGRVGGSWPYTYFRMLNSPNFTAEAQWIYLRSNLDHVTLLTNGLKNRGRSGNWVVAECSALYTMGVLFPECKDSGQWRDIALERLTFELNRIVPPDGMEAELTVGYHYFCLNSFVQPLKLAKLNNLPIPDIFLKKITDMYRAPIWVMDQHGFNVPTNDSGPYNTAHVANDAIKMGISDPTLDWATSGGKKGVQPPDSTMLPYAGFYAMRGGWKLNDFYLFFRGGPVGIGHEHNDMLEVVLRAWNKTLLFDPGTYVYDHSDWRRYTVGTSSHNTIIVDGKWQHRDPAPPASMEPVTNPWVTTPVFDYVAATYDAGYQQNVYNQNKGYMPMDWVGPVDHSITHTRRVLFLRPYYALVLDTLDGTGSHTFDAHFHLDAPAAHVDPATQVAYSDNTDRTQLALFPLDRDNLKTEIVQGQKDPLLGWYPVWHKPIPTVRFRKEQVAPAIFATFLYPYQGTAPALDATPLAVTGAGVWGQSFNLPSEKAQVAVVKDGTAQSFSFTSPAEGSVQAEASGLVLRDSIDSKEAFAGGWNLRSYGDDKKQFSLDAPGTILVSSSGDPGKLLFYNAGDKAVSVTVAKPFAHVAALPTATWTEVSKDSDSAVPPPALFPPMEDQTSTAATKPAANPALVVHP